MQSVILLLLAASASARNPDGTLGLVRRPASTHPQLAVPGDRFTIRAAAGPDATPEGWSVELSVPDTVLEPVRLPVEEAVWDAGLDAWLVTVSVPADTPAEVYDLSVTTGAGSDTNLIAVAVFDAWPESYTFAHYSDTQNLFAVPGITGTYEAIVRDLDVLQPVFAINTGDLITYGTEDEYRDYIAVLEGGRVPTFHIPGNHDVFWVTCWDREAQQERYERYIGDRDYGFAFGDHYFYGFELSGYQWLCPYANLSDEQALQLEWGLSDHAAAPLKVLFGHQVEYDADVLEAVADSHGVDAYLYGHIHEDAISHDGTTLWESVGWAGDGHYRMIRVESGDITEYTANDPVASISGGDAVFRDLYYDEAVATHATALFTSSVDQDLHDVRFRVAMPLPDGERYVAEPGEVYQTVEAPGVAYVYVRGVPLPALGTTEVLLDTEPIPVEPEDTGTPGSGRTTTGDDTGRGAAPVLERAGGCGCASVAVSTPGGSSGPGGAPVALLGALLAFVTARRGPPTSGGGRTSV